MTPPPLYATPKASLQSTAESEDLEDELLVHPSWRDQTTPTVAGNSGQAVNSHTTELSQLSPPFNSSIGVVSMSTSQSSAAISTTEWLSTSPGVVASTTTNDTISNDQFADDTEPPNKEEVIKGVLVSGMPHFTSGLATKRVKSQTNDATQQAHRQVTPAARLEPGTTTPENQHHWTPPPLCHTTTPVKRSWANLDDSGNRDGKWSRLNDTPLQPQPPPPPPSNHTCEFQEGNQPRLKDPPHVQPSLSASRAASIQERRRQAKSPPPTMPTFDTVDDCRAHLKKLVHNIFSVPRVPSPDPLDELDEWPADKSTNQLLASTGLTPTPCALALDGSSLLAKAASSHFDRGNGQIGGDGLELHGAASGAPTEVYSPQGAVREPLGAVCRSDARDKNSGYQSPVEFDCQTNRPFYDYDSYASALRRDLEKCGVSGSFKAVASDPTRQSLFDAVATDASVLLATALSADDLRKVVVEVQMQNLTSFPGATRTSLESILNGDADGGENELVVLATIVDCPIHIVTFDGALPNTIQPANGAHWQIGAQLLTAELCFESYEKLSGPDVYRRLHRYCWERREDFSITLWYHNHRLTNRGDTPMQATMTHRPYKFDLLRRVLDDGGGNASGHGGGRTPQRGRGAPVCCHGRNASQGGASSAAVGHRIPPPPILGPAAILKRDYKKSREEQRLRDAAAARALKGNEPGFKAHPSKPAKATVMQLTEEQGEVYDKARRGDALSEDERLILSVVLRGPPLPELRPRLPCNKPVEKIFPSRSTDDQASNSRP